MLHLLAPIASIALAWSVAANPPELRREALMAALRQGGYTVLLRHARTDRSFNEVREYVPKERSAQRNLNDDGIRDAALMGAVFRKYGITFAEILSSPMYRTLETAEMAAGTPTLVTMALRVIPSTAEQAALVSAAPTPGTNRLLVTHHFVIETHVPGISPGDVGESEAAVVKHVDGKVELVGRITLDDWRLLANPGGATSATVAANSASASHTAPHPVPAGQPASADSSAKFPDTHAGHIAREYVAAFNSGNKDRMRAFFTDWMVLNPDRPIDERLDSYIKMFEHLGPISLQAVERSESIEVVLGMRAKPGNFRITVKSSETQPMRATSVTFALPGAHR
jgi:phosphohistidine phosphatase SixA